MTSGRSLRTHALVAVVLPAVMLGGCGGEPTSAPGAGDGETATASLSVQGMTCEGCSVDVHGVLLKHEGVVAVEVDLAAARAEVRYHPAQVRPEVLVEALATAGYPATLDQVGRTAQAGSGR